MMSGFCCRKMYGKLRRNDRIKVDAASGASSCANRHGVGNRDEEHREMSVKIARSWPVREEPMGTGRGVRWRFGKQTILLLTGKRKRG